MQTQTSLCLVSYDGVEEDGGFDRLAEVFRGDGHACGTYCDDVTWHYTLEVGVTF